MAKPTPIKGSNGRHEPAEPAPPGPTFARPNPRAVHPPRWHAQTCCTHTAGIAAPIATAPEPLAVRMADPNAVPPVLNIPAGAVTIVVKHDSCCWCGPWRLVFTGLVQPSDFTEHGPWISIATDVQLPLRGMGVPSPAPGPAGQAAGQALVLAREDYLRDIDRAVQSGEITVDGRLAQQRGPDLGQGPGPSRA